VLRLVGGTLDVVVLSVLYAVIVGVIAHRHAHLTAPLRLIAPAVGAVYEVVPVALWGRTFGKLLAGTRVVAIDDEATPGWRSAAVRWLVPAVPTLIVGAVPGRALASVAFQVVGNLWAIVVYLGVLTNRQRRGLHDMAARTVVVVARRTQASTATH
jgi:uncharacterized RDD family membrane protein YckC